MAHEVTNATTDRDQLASIAGQAKEAMERSRSVITPVLMPFTVAFMGERPSMDAEWQHYLREGRYAEASTVTHVTSDDAAFMLIHAVEDANVSAEHLTIMDEAVRAAGLPVETMLVDENTHFPELNHSAIVRWLEAQLL